MTKKTIAAAITFRIAYNFIINFYIHSIAYYLSKLKRAASAIGAPDMVLEKNGAGSSLTVKDKKNATANNYSLDVNTQSDGEFNFFFKVENLKLLDGTYDVEISAKNISHYKNKNSDIEYWIALEPESTYTV